MQKIQLISWLVLILMWLIAVPIFLFWQNQGNNIIYLIEL